MADNKIIRSVDSPFGGIGHSKPELSNILYIALRLFFWVKAT
jgi:hypothetical protein